MKIDGYEEISEEEAIKKMHFVMMINGRLSYLCNQACGISKDKSTNDFFKVTCRNCHSILIKDLKKVERKKAIEEFVSILRHFGEDYPYVNMCWDENE